MSVVEGGAGLRYGGRGSNGAFPLVGGLPGVDSPS